MIINTIPELKKFFRFWKAFTYQRVMGIFVFTRRCFACSRISQGNIGRTPQRSWNESRTRLFLERSKVQNIKEKWILKYSSNRGLSLICLMPSAFMMYNLLV